MTRLWTQDMTTFLTLEHMSLDVEDEEYRCDARHIAPVSFCSEICTGKLHLCHIAPSYCTRVILHRHIAPVSYCTVVLQLCHIAPSCCTCVVLHLSLDVKDEE